MERIYLTKEGYEKLFQELEYLKKVKRKELSKRIEEARSLGDISENAEYDSAKEAQLNLEKKIRELETKLSSAVIISPEDVNLEKASVGTKVLLKDLDTGEEFFYIILSDEEADFERNEIGISSPVACALLGKKKEDVVEIKVPRGILRYKILDISLP
ncbi:MAG: transcription elongation factor GreA [Candidatus Omnitrophota bacterium]|nr:MAG: transcription elongation factor GreA [Candidatus Omnitrophota bacterium]RKY43959.1 MAG: transcription elongation factor GreA [Candidatus Omnitrophota bacterium]